MKIIEILKKKNRTLLEMYIGIVFCGLVCQLVGAFIVKDQVIYAKSLWFGILMAAASTLHMYRSIDRALGNPQDASKTVFLGYMIRYALLVIILLLIIKTEVMNPIIVFMAYMSLKVTAFLQPFTHKLCNKVFHETDPVPQALPPSKEDGTAEEHLEERYSTEEIS